MTRVSTLGQNQLILRNTQLTQTQLFDLQRQVSSGERSDTFKGLGSEGVVLNGAKSRLARMEQLVSNNDRTKSKLDLREVAVRQIVEIASNLKEEYLRAESLTDSTQLAVFAESELQRVANILNTRDGNGDFLFAGSRTDTEPVTLAATGGVPAFTVTFNNDTIVERANIDDKLTVDIGVLAADDPSVPSGPFQGLIDILNFFAAGVHPPPLAPAPLPTDSAAGITADQVVALIDQAFDTVNNLNAELGIRQRLLEEANVRLDFEIDLTTEFVATVRDADMADLIVRVNQEQVALQASFRVTAELSDLTLTNFLLF